MANAHETPSPVDDHHGVGDVVPMKILVAVFSALVALTIITYLASLVNFGEFNLIVALGIAVIKASLVVLFFMHLRWDRPFNAIVFVGCIIFVAIFLGFTLIDTTQYHHSVYTDQAPGMKNHVPMKAEKLPG